MDLLGPTPLLTIDRLKLALYSVTQDLKPNHLSLRQRKTDSAVLKDCGVASHRMRSTDHAVINVICSGKCGDVQRSLKLMRLHADHSHKRRFFRIAQKLEILEI